MRSKLEFVNLVRIVNKICVKIEMLIAVPQISSKDRILNGTVERVFFSTTQIVQEIVHAGRRTLRARDWLQHLTHCHRTR